MPLVEQETTYPSRASHFTPWLLVGFVLLGHQFFVRCVVDCCLLFFELRILITILVSSNSPYSHFRSSNDKSMPLCQTYSLQLTRPNCYIQLLISLCQTYNLQLTKPNCYTQLLISLCQTYNLQLTRTNCDLQLLISLCQTYSLQLTRPNCYIELLI